MISFEALLAKANFPSSEDLIRLTMHDSAFANKTRYMRTNSGLFQNSQKPLEQGTWSFTSIEKNFLDIKKACNHIKTITNQRVQCNAYFTPQNAQGLPIHYDLHVVVQIEGSKNWKTWPAFRKSISLETLLEDEQGNLPKWTSQIAPREVRLTGRDTLYLKKGEPHVAETTSESSLHFSFGIYHD